MEDKIRSFFVIWLVILVINQVFIFGACFAPYCLLAALPHTGVLAFIWTYFVSKKTPDQNEKDSTSFESIKKSVNKTPVKQPRTVKIKTHKPSKENLSKKDPMKEKGDIYEKYIGGEFEKKGDLVIYNGFIRGYKDQGVDIVSIRPACKTINLVQCKNWTSMRMTLEHMQDIYSKLNNYNFDCLNLSSKEVNTHRADSKNNDATKNILYNTKANLATYNIRKTLYIASEKVVNLDVGPYLTMMSPTIFKFKDMKIVMKSSSTNL
jgi:hypothetical protein